MNQKRFISKQYFFKLLVSVKLVSDSKPECIQWKKSGSPVSIVQYSTEIITSNIFHKATKYSELTQLNVYC